MAGFAEGRGIEARLRANAAGASLSSARVQN